MYNQESTSKSVHCQSVHSECVQSKCTMSVQLKAFGQFVHNL